MLSSNLELVITSKMTITLNTPMEEGPEFEYTQDELQQLANNLQK